MDYYGIFFNELIISEKFAKSLFISNFPKLKGGILWEFSKSFK